jgi:hypothetical protein
MFRENVLIKDDVIERISQTMVPVVLDYQKVLNRNSREARFLLPMMKEKAKDDLQGFWLFTPAGKNLGHGVGFVKMKEKTMRMIDNALDAFGTVEPRRFEKVELNPHRGIGFRTDGSVRLAEYVRRRDRSNISSPVISSVSLSAQEFQAFAPSTTARKNEWTVPIPVARKLCRIASPMCYQHAPQPDWVKVVTLRAKTGTVSNGLISSEETCISLPIESTCSQNNASEHSHCASPND